MSSRFSKAITLALAVFYALLVSLGHALHSHGDCGENATCTEVVCSCGHHHGPVKPNGTDDRSTSSWRSAGDDHCCQDCAACELMSHLKVGHHSVEQFALASALFYAWSTAYQTPFCVPVHEAWAPRGPPLGISA